MTSEFAYSDRIESEIRNNSKYRYVVIDLGIESISCDIQISSEYLNEEYGDHRSDDFTCDLCNGIGVDFSIWHVGEYMGKYENVK